MRTRRGEAQLALGPLVAAALVVTLPVMVLTGFIQRQIVTGSGG